MSDNSVKTFEISDFGDLTLPTADQLFNYALLITGDDSKAEKLVRSTYEKALPFFQHLSAYTDIKLWLFRILIKICRDEFSREDSNIQSENISKEIDITKTNIQTLEQEPSFKITQQLITEISVLPFNLKEVLALRDIIKFDFDTIADLVDIPIGTVKKRIFDARKFLLIKLFQGKIEIVSGEGHQLNYEDKKNVISFIESEIEPNKEQLKDFKNEIDAQNFIKSFIQSNLKLQPPREAFKLRLTNKYASGNKGELRRKYSGENRSLVTGATIAMIILIAVLILVSRPTVVNSAELAKEQIGNNNILVQLKNNYSLYKMGKYDKQIVSGNEEYLRSYLSSEGFESKPVFINYDGWNLAYCFTTEFEGKKAANYLYKKSDNNYLYFYQVPLHLLQDKKVFKLSDNLLGFLESRQCFSSRKENLVYLLKKSGENILGFVVSIKNKDLIIELCAH